jgi:ribosomal protein S27E
MWINIHVIHLKSRDMRNFCTCLAFKTIRPIPKFLPWCGTHIAHHRLLQFFRAIFLTRLVCCHMYATGPKRHYFTRSFRSTDLSFRSSCPPVASTYRYTLQENLMSTFKCGRLERGFLRVRCKSCHDEKLVAFSCKRRGFCPSCGARHMADSAVWLVDEVLPHRPIRQWVLSVPISGVSGGSQH